MPSSATPPATTTAAREATPPTPPATADASGKKFRVVVSFVSKGAGIDTKTRDKVVGVFDKWRIEKSAELKTVRPHWGKEGEMDVCSELAGLKEDEQAKFVSEIKAAATSDRVTVSENAACHPENK